MSYFSPIAISSFLLAGASTLSYAVSGKSSQIFGKSVYRGPGIRRSIALTFDDGPSEGSMYVLDYLEKEGISATFFQCGINVTRHPKIAHAIAHAGHAIGNHTYSHARLCPRIGWHPNLKSFDAIYREFALAQEVIQDEVGISPSLFRPPYGLRWFGVGAAQKRLNLLGVMWTVIGQDWQRRSADISNIVLTNVKPGGIVCLHDGRDIQPTPDISEMLSALRLIIPVLKDQGYSFETVTQLLNLDHRQGGR